MKKILITGVAGFIGSNLLNELLLESKNYKIIGIDNFSTGQSKFINKFKKIKNFSLINEDLSNYKKINKYFKNIDTVFHLSALADVRRSSHERELHYKNNILVTQNIIELCVRYKVKHILFTSTGSVYGNRKDKKPFGENDFFPIQNSFYAASKLSSEALLTSLSFSHNIKISIIRLVSVLGKNYTHGHLIDFVKKFKESSGSIKVLGNGYQTKSYVSVDDVIAAIKIIIEKQKSKCEIYNIGLNEVRNVKNSIKLIKKYFGFTNRVTYGKNKQGWIGDNPYILLDTKKIRKLGWKPKYNINESILKTLDWLKEYTK